MKRNLSEGTEVFIYKYNIFNLEYDMRKYIKGKIIGCKLSDDLSQHGSPWYEEIYTVLGEDEKIYEGIYGKMIRTPEDHIAYLGNLINRNNDEINRRKKANDEYIDMIEIAMGKKLTSSPKVKKLSRNKKANGNKPNN